MSLKLSNFNQQRSIAALASKIVNGYAGVAAAVRLAAVECRA
jgi:hypothetical protein